MMCDVTDMREGEREVTLVMVRGRYENGEFLKLLATAGWQDGGRQKKVDFLMSYQYTAADKRSEKEKPGEEGAERK